MTDAINVPVVDGVTAVVKLAESLVALGLSASNALSYATSRVMRLTPMAASEELLA